MFRGVSFQLAIDEAKTSASRMLTPLFNFDKALGFVRDRRAVAVEVDHVVGPVVGPPVVLGFFQRRDQRLERGGAAEIDRHLGPIGKRFEDRFGNS